MDLEKLAEQPPWEWPEDTDQRLIEILRDPDTVESERLLAADLAGDPTVINDALADALLSIMADNAAGDELRGTAVISLGPALENAYIMAFDDEDDILISEDTYHRIQAYLQTSFSNTDIPDAVRRRILEASVRSAQDWHSDAVRAAYLSDDEEWQLTAVFCMCYIRGFEDQILSALESKNDYIHYHAICAAGNWEVDAAWTHIRALVTSKETEKALRLAAIEAVAGIRPQEAGILGDFLTDADEDISEAAFEALTMAEAISQMTDLE